MSAEHMKSEFVRRPSDIRLSSVRPSVRVAIISEPNAQIPFKFWLLLPLGHTLGHFVEFQKRKKSGDFYVYLSFSLT